KFASKLAELMAATPENALLTAGICAAYGTGVQRRSGLQRVVASSASSAGFRATAALFETDIDSLSSNAELADELFGPSTLIVRHRDREQLLRFAESLEGHLTATIHGTEDDLRESADLIAILEHKVGRIVFNGFPTGV